MAHSAKKGKDPRGLPEGQGVLTTGPHRFLSLSSFLPCYGLGLSHISEILNNVPR